MYLACSFDVVFRNNESDWCSMFDMDDILAAEYGEDLDSYWTKCTESYFQLCLMMLVAYGNALNYNISCLLLNEILGIMEGKMNDAEDLTFQTSKFRFAHAETIIPLASILVRHTRVMYFILTKFRVCTSQIQMRP